MMRFLKTAISIRLEPGVCVAGCDLFRFPSFYVWMYGGAVGVVDEGYVAFERKKWWGWS